MIQNNKVIFISGIIVFCVIIFVMILGVYLRRGSNLQQTSIVPTFSPSNEFSGRRFNPQQTVTSSNTEVVLKEEVYSIDSGRLSDLIPVNQDAFDLEKSKDGYNVVVDDTQEKAEQEFKTYLQEKQLTTNGRPITITFIKKKNVSTTSQNGIGAGQNQGQGGSSTGAGSGTSTGSSNSTATQDSQTFADNPNSPNNPNYSPSQISQIYPTSETLTNNSTSQNQNIGYESEEQKELKEKFLEIFSNVVDKVSDSQTQTVALVATPTPGESTPVEPTPSPKDQKISTNENILPINQTVGSNNKVIDIVNAMVKACGNIITKNNVDCIERMNPGLNKTAKNYVYSSARSFVYYQCVGFVKTIMAQLGYPPINETNPGAKDYTYNYPKSTYNFIKKGSECIRVGDIPIWSGGAYGHIAIVSQVYDCKNFELAEANYKANGYVGLRKTTTDYGSLAGWLRPKE